MLKTPFSDLQVWWLSSFPDSFSNYIKPFVEPHALLFHMLGYVHIVFFF